jgi:hypothetical protein
MTFSSKEKSFPKSINLEKMIQKLKRDHPSYMDQRLGPPNPGREIRGLAEIKAKPKEPVMLIADAQADVDLWVTNCFLSIVPEN